ncbi:anhydro-N-acetylmuramic acid kinase [Aurantimonas sp. MSK8Z-1]|uniref:anhydro-N-acetylmuramic acid kinase n=1 Tax=Mangrovibrevibacter kandeliae TaxID=2968473 RepID=UPI00211937A8|nr:anhydro-N-acetylmuramic acid kinase [Aurantimonas sp. MSK8Z-1]MCW4114650.1 anhydro-N-acetylmuramic acid kinase [Aurantimonas sp. MSK8Z-1]
MSDNGTLRAIGLMSGTSLDGIDVALLDTDGAGLVRRGPSRGYPYEAAFRERLAAALQAAKSIEDRDARPGDLAALDREIAERHAEAVRRFAADCGIDLASVDLVGFHGQTVLHRPEWGLTVQIGDGQRLAEALGLPVIHDMRAADMAAGGQGAPLVPAYHAALAAGLPDALQPEGPVAFVNIGGISNVTFIDGEAEPVAFDSGPGMALIDQWVQREAGIPFDQNGTIASEGGIVATLAASYLDAPFFERPAPKSLDRFDFAVPEKGAGALEDVARTLAFVTAEAILKAAEQMPRQPRLWIICGGGRRHPLIMQDLREGAARRGARAILAEEAGLDGDAMEAEAWAYLAVRSVKGLPLTFPGTTGCRAPTTGGVSARPAALTSGASAWDR